MADARLENRTEILDWSTHWKLVRGQTREGMFIREPGSTPSNNLYYPAIKGT